MDRINARALAAGKLYDVFSCITIRRQNNKPTVQDIRIYEYLEVVLGRGIRSTTVFAVTFVGKSARTVSITSACPRNKLD